MSTTYWYITYEIREQWNPKNKITGTLVVSYERDTLCPVQAMLDILDTFKSVHDVTHGVEDECEWSGSILYKEQVSRESFDRFNMS